MKQQTLKELNYLLDENAVLARGAERKLRDAEYILDSERPIPSAVK